jgi:hypothetical protein
LLLHYFFDIMCYIIAKSLTISGDFILSYSFALAAFFSLLIFLSGAGAGAFIG